MCGSCIDLSGLILERNTPKQIGSPVFKSTLKEGTYSVAWFIFLCLQRDGNMKHNYLPSPGLSDSYTRMDRVKPDFLTTYQTR